MTGTVAIVGLGSRGLGVLERIVALAGDRPLTVHVIDPGQPGDGLRRTVDCRRHGFVSSAAVTRWRA